MTPKEIDFLNARISKRSKDMLKEDSDKLGISMTEYLERLIEGTLPGRLEAETQALRLEIEALRKEIKR